MKCDKCGNEVATGSLFCDNCGNRLEKKKSSVVCPVCGKENKEGSVFCGECGRKLPVVPAMCPDEDSCEKICPECGKSWGADAEFCGECGKSLKAVVEKKETHASSVRRVIISTMCKHEKKVAGGIEKSEPKAEINEFFSKAGDNDL